MGEQKINVGVVGEVMGWRPEGEDLAASAAALVLEAERHGNRGRARIHLQIKGEVQPGKNQSRLAATLATAIWKDLNTQDPSDDQVDIMPASLADVVLQGMIARIDFELAQIRAAFEDVSPCPIVSHHTKGPCVFCAAYALRDVLMLEKKSDPSTI